MRRIERIHTETKLDADASFAHIGVYSDTPGPFAVDRQAYGKMNPFQYRYFNPANVDNDTDAYMNFMRAESLNDGDWHFIGVQVVAEISTSTDFGNTWLCNRLASGGLWGIESDSSESYLREVASEQLNELAEHLQLLGFDPRDIHAAASESGLLV